MVVTVLILGSGPAGLTAAIYVARGGLLPIVIEGPQPGGQLTLTSEVENFPGFPEGVQGPDLTDMFRKQAERFGTKLVGAVATAVDLSKQPFRVVAGNQEYFGDAVIIATGSSAMWLGLESEQRLRGRGVSSCGTCDGFFFKGQDVVVVGGGDSAMEEALFLTKFAKTVTVVHRRDYLRASRILQQRAFQNEKIRFIWNSTIEEVLGKDRVEGIRIRNLKTNQVSQFQCQGLFIAIGHRPNTEILRGQLELDERGYIKTFGGGKTSIEGVFVAGDVSDYVYRQAVTAAGSGSRAAMETIRYLEKQEAGSRLSR